MTSTPIWTDPELALTVDAAACFRAPMERIALEVGDRIYRLRTNREGQRGTSLVKSQCGRDPGSAWWFRQETFDAIVRGASQARGNITAAGRTGLAVPKRFNADFDTLVIYRLLRRGFAWSGPAAEQSRNKDGSSMLPGGLEQLWIPGIGETEVRFEFFGSIRARI